MRRIHPTIDKTGYFPGAKIRCPVFITWLAEQLKIGKHVLVSPFCSISARHQIDIGKGTIIGPGVCIIDHDHFIDGELNEIGRTGKSAPIKIGNYCWIGANAVILKGVTLGDGCVVGAGAVVTKSFPEKSIVVGNPAKLLRRR